MIPAPLAEWPGGQGVITGPLGDGWPSPDQAATHGLLVLIRDPNLTMISVTSGGPPTQVIGKE